MAQNAGRSKRDLFPAGGMAPSGTGDRAEKGSSSGKDKP